MPRHSSNAVPSLAELRKHSTWAWVYCERGLGTQGGLRLRLTRPTKMRLCANRVGSLLCEAYPHLSEHDIQAVVTSRLRPPALAW